MREQSVAGLLSPKKRPVKEASVAQASETRHDLKEPSMTTPCRAVITHPLGLLHVLGSDNSIIIQGKSYWYVIYDMPRGGYFKSSISLNSTKFIT